MAASALPQGYLACFIDAGLRAVAGICALLPAPVAPLPCRVLEEWP